jgi:pimeloyl-ACP methyl ester carboxylesterase
MEPLSLHVGGLTFGGYTAGPSNADLVILLHGFPQTARAWRHELQALAADGFRAVAPHLRGYCDTARPDAIADYRLDMVARDIMGIADSLLAERFHLVGHDVGGIVGWELACRHPERLLSLTVASTPHLSPFAAALADPTQKRIPPFDLFRRPVPIPETALLADDAGLLRAGYVGLDTESIDVYVRTFAVPGALSAALNYFRAFDFASWRELPSTPVPTLFIWGEEDPYLAAATADATAGHVSGPYRSQRLTGVGHWVPELAADTVTRLLHDHLSTAT